MRVLLTLLFLKISFGFGGTNAHVILESYDPSSQPVATNAPALFIPFVFSATSEASLKSYLAALCDYLRKDEISHDLRDIAYSLAVRRTHFPVAVALGASTVTELCAKLEGKLEMSPTDPGSRVGVRTFHQTAASGAGNTARQVLGIFTGQGSQWAQMGSELIAISAASRRILQDLESRLDQLPVADRPKWSLTEELQKDESVSRISEAAFSQPLCTAIQIMQVDLLHIAGIEFTAVVGHSSGEIVCIQPFQVDIWHKLIHAIGCSIRCKYYLCPRRYLYRLLPRSALEVFTGT